MANKIPPSLNWLIDKRARLAAELKKTELSLAKAQKLIQELEKLQKNLAAVDATLELHHIKVDVSSIDPIKSKYLHIDIPHGELTRSILICIRLYGENGPVPKEVILDFVIKRHFSFDAEKISYNRISRCVQSRLKSLCQRGFIARHHDQKTNVPGLWSLSAKSQIYLKI